MSWSSAPWDWNDPSGIVLRDVLSEIETAFNDKQIMIKNSDMLIASNASVTPFDTDDEVLSQLGTNSNEWRYYQLVRGVIALLERCWNERQDPLEYKLWTYADFMAYHGFDPMLFSVYSSESAMTSESLKALYVMLNECNYFSDTSENNHISKVEFISSNNRSPFSAAVANFPDGPYRLSGVTQRIYNDTDPFGNTNTLEGTWHIRQFRYEFTYDIKDRDNNPIDLDSFTVCWSLVNPFYANDTFIGAQPLDKRLSLGTNTSTAGSLLAKSEIEPTYGLPHFNGTYYQKTEWRTQDELFIKINDLLVTSYLSVL